MLAYSYMVSLLVFACYVGAGTDEIPGFVFLVHIVDVMASLHSNLRSRSHASVPYRATAMTVLVWPLAFVIMLMMWAWSKTFVFTFYRLRGRLFQTWVVPRHGFQVRPRLHQHPPFLHFFFPKKRRISCLN